MRPRDTMPRWRGDAATDAAGDGRGFSLVELLVALAVMSVGVAFVAMLAAAVVGAFEVEPATADANQRMRSTLAALIDDVRSAGSGFLVRADDAPGHALPAVFPDRLASGGWTISPRPSVLTAWHARRGVGPARLSVAAPAGTTLLRLERPPFCPAGSASCGFASGDDLALYGAHGQLATAAVRQMRPPLDLELVAPLAMAWPAGSAVAAVTAHTYELRPDPSTGLSQIARRLGTGPMTPVVDFVTRFDVEWRLIGGTPTVLVAPGGVEEHASAGPAPPPAGVVDRASWPAGENCAFARSAAGEAMWRGSANPPMTTAVPLTALGDGPWCPDALSATKWDLDLARVAEVRVVLGVAAAAATLRPAVGLGLRRPTGTRPIADLVLETTIRPGRRGLGG